MPRRTLLVLFIFLMFSYAAGWSASKPLLVYVGEHAGQSDLFLFDPGAGRTYELTGDPAVEQNPLWSPDGGMIAYTRNQGEGDIAVCIIRPDGSDNKQLTSKSDHAVLKQWLDSWRISYISSMPDGNMALGVIDLRAGTKRVVTTKGTDYAWSPDGTWALVITGGDKPGLARIGYSGQDYRQLTPGEGESSPDISPDGRYIVFQGPEKSTTTTPGIWIMDSDGAGRKKISSTGFLPEFIGNDSIIYSEIQNGKNQVWLMDTNGDGKKKIADGRDPVIGKGGIILYQDKDELWMLNLRTGTSGYLLRDVISYDIWNNYAMVVQRSFSGKYPAAGVLLVDLDRKEALKVSGGIASAREPAAASYRRWNMRIGKYNPSAKPVKTKTPGLPVPGTPSATSPETSKTTIAKGLKLLVKSKTSDLSMHSPSWSADGKKLAFAFVKVYHDTRTAGGGAGIINSNGSGLKIIYEEKPGSVFEHLGFVSPRFSPDGRYVAFMKRSWLAANAESGDVLVTDLKFSDTSSLNPYVVLNLKMPVPAVYGAPKWMKKGDYVFFGARQSEGYQADPRLEAVWKAGATGNYDDAVYRNGDLDLSISMPTPSPDGKMLAFVMSKFKNPVYVKLCLLDISIRDRQPVSLMEIIPPQEIQFSKDGNRLACITKDQLYIINLAGLKAVKKQFKEGPAALTGDFLVFAYINDGNLVLEDTRNKNRRVISLDELTGKEIDGLAWSPDGKTLAISAGGEIWIYCF
ncbi:MAG: hypothetical protein M1269_06220 [Chloroflexi bacterium]|nr:hypothetical protein [Chloroflexota bacterium]